MTEFTVEELVKLPRVLHPDGKKQPDLSKNDVLVFLPQPGIAFIHDWEGHTQRLFKRTEKGTYIEQTPDYTGLVGLLLPGFDPSIFLLDVIKTMAPEEQLKLAEMLRQKSPEKAGEESKPVKPKTKQDSRCAHLIVTAGGHTMTINLRG